MVKYYTIKKDALVEGIRRCMYNVENLLNYAEKLVEDESENNIALGLYSFAIEEYGKALLLKEYLSENKTQYSIPTNLFRGKESHDLKFKKALDRLPMECKYAIPGIRIKSNSYSKTKEFIVTPKGDSISIAPGITGTFTTIGTFPTDFEMRMSCFYVDWDVTRDYWKYRPKIISESIITGITKFRKIIDDFWKTLD